MGGLLPPVLLLLVLLFQVLFLQVLLLLVLPAGGWGREVVAEGGGLLPRVLLLQELPVLPASRAEYRAGLQDSAASHCCQPGLPYSADRGGGVGLLS